MKSNSISDKLKSFKCCVIVPTYNNHKTLGQVLSDILNYTGDVIVINDGSTDASAAILDGFPEIHRIDLPNNVGKGNALRLGFEKACKLDFDYAITIDSDGQHFADDIPSFLENLETEQIREVLYIGARNMAQEGVPKKSSFGNRFSNFWFWVETGIRLKDSQSGFRLYPLFAMKDLKLRTNKFEFEIEVIVKAAWSGIVVKNIPIKVHYELVDRVTHFRPFRDFTRIGILNTWLVFLTIFYIKPRNIFRKLKQKGIKRFFIEDLLGSADSAEKKALSIALGVLIGVSPLWGLHTVSVIFLAIFFRLNSVIAFAFSNVSLPPFIPFIFYFSIKIGGWILGDEVSFSLHEIDFSVEMVKHLKTYLVGSIALAISLSIFSGLISYVFFSLLERKKIIKNG